MSRNFHKLGKLCWVTSNARWCGSQAQLLLKHRSNLSGPVHSTSLSTYGSISRRTFSQIPQGTLERSLQGERQDDRIKMFIDPQVQTLLKELTGRDLKRIFRKRKIGQKIREPKYTFMTEAELEHARNEAEERADQLLQMPPVLRPREPIDTIMSFDPYIQGQERSTLIFTDITMNVSDRDRIIVARDPDGTLRQATWQEREKMNAIYFPQEGREFTTPRMFTEPEALQNVLNRASDEDNTYEFVLDRACLQFEPDDPLYISSVETTYETIDQRGHYDFLKSTRHYGPMVFYLVRTRKLDGILLHSIKHGRIHSDAVKLVSLFQILFPKCKSALKKPCNDDVEKVMQYVQLDAIKRGELEIALNAFIEEEQRKSDLTEGLERQHGIQQ